MVAIRCLAEEQGPNPKLAQTVVGKDVIEQFEKADKWLKPMRPWWMMRYEENKASEVTRHFVWEGWSNDLDVEWSCKPTEIRTLDEHGKYILRNIAAYFMSWL